MEVPDDWKRGNVTPIFRRGKVKRIQANQCHFNHSEDCRANPPENHIQAHEDKKLIGTTIRNLSRANCIWPTWLMVVYNGMWCWADKGRTVDALHFYFSKAFDVVCHMVVSLRTGWVDYHIGGKLSWLLAIRSRDQQLKVQLIGGFQWHTSAADTAAKTV